MSGLRTTFLQETRVQSDICALFINSYSYLEAVGEAKCFVMLAGDSDLLTGDPQPGDAVLLSLRSLSFCKKRWLHLKQSASSNIWFLKRSCQGTECARSDLWGVGSGLRTSLKAGSVICMVY